MVEMSLTKELQHYRASLDLWWARRKRIAAQHSAVHQRQREAQRVVDQQRAEQGLREAALAAGRPVEGWYADPQNPAFERRWDGAAWTEETRMAPPGAAGRVAVVPGAVPVPAAVSNSSLQTAGVITFILGLLFWPIFIASFVIGIMLTTRGSVGNGVLLIVMSLLGPIISLAGCAALLTSGS